MISSKLFAQANHQTFNPLFGDRNNTNSNTIKDYQQSLQDINRQISILESSRDNATSKTNQQILDELTQELAVAIKNKQNYSEILKKNRVVGFRHFSLGPQRFEKRFEKEIYKGYCWEVCLIERQIELLDCYGQATSPEDILKCVENSRENFQADKFPSVIEPLARHAYNSYKLKSRSLTGRAAFELREGYRKIITNKEDKRTAELEKLIQRKQELEKLLS